MPYKEVKKAIDELKVELGNTPTETSSMEGVLDQARNGIERYTPEAVQELIETLQHESDEFEAEHPRVAELVNRLATALSSLGI